MFGTSSFLRLITGVAWTITEPVRMSMIPAVVPKEDIANAVALNSGGFNLMKVIGPALGGALIALFGPAENFFLQAIAYAGVLAMIYWMHIPPHRAEAKSRSAVANLKEGFAYVWSTPAVLALMALAYVPRIFAVPYQTLMPVFQKDVLKIGPEGLGLLMAAPGLGAVIAVLTMASLGSRIKRQGLLVGGQHHCARRISHIFFPRSLGFPSRSSFWCWSAYFKCFFSPARRQFCK